MKHYEYEIGLFLDGELSKEEQKELFSHLADCKECQNSLSEILRLKEKSKIYFADSLNTLKSKPKTANLFYKIGFYTSGVAAIILLFILVGIKPEEKFYARNEVRVDTVFIQKTTSDLEDQAKQTNSFDPGKKELNPETSQKAYLNYVMSLRSVKITSADIIKTKNGS